MEKVFHKVLLGIGSNIGDRVGICCSAIENIKIHPKITSTVVSPFYETAPVGVTNQPPFINLAVKVATLFSPDDLLKELKTMESKLGRVRRYRWGPREVDLDILLYDDVVISTTNLKIPHPEMHKRAFVLVPACDIAPGWEHPVSKKPLKLLLTTLSREGVSRYQGTVPCV